MAGTSVTAKNLNEVRIYINPGHGSWGPNDRPMPTIPYPNLADTGRPDTCGFYESNTNLWKAVKLGETLQKLGAQDVNIMYSRTLNGPFPYVKGADDEMLYNRSLSEICEEVDANNMDYFISIHSNAASEGTPTNYPLFLYRGKDNGDDYAKGSYDICQAAWPFLNSNVIDPTTAYQTSTNIRGDISFYGTSSDRPGSNGQIYTGYLGVMKHGCPGYLSEGYFHTYQPARHRALNKDYCGQEGIRYARGIAEYFGATGEPTGYIMGTVKDLHEKITHSLYKYAVGSDDQWLPLNGATVELYKGDKKIDEYTIDKNYNGIFVFENLQPGADYTLNYICAGYKPAIDEYKQPITVKKNETTYVKAFLESENYVPPTPPSIIYTNYPDPIQDADIRVADRYLFEEKFADRNISVLADKIVRRAIMRGDSLFVLALDAQKAPYLYLINPETQEVIKTLNTSGTQGGIYALSDIAFTADGILCGCNMEETQFTPSGTFRVYKWADYDTAPAVWFTSQKSGNYTAANTGNTLAITGDSQNCKVITSATTTGSSLATRILIFNIENGVNVSDVRNQDGSVYSAINWGNDFYFTISPRDDDNLIIDGSNTLPLEYKLSEADVTAMTLIGKWSNPKIDAKTNGATFFRYALQDLMITPVTDGSGNNTGVALFDISDGLDKAKEILTPGTIQTEASVNYTMSAASVNNADITVHLVKSAGGSSMSKFTTESVTQPIVKGVYAYDLKVTSTSASHTFSFMATDDAVSGTLIFEDTLTDVTVGKIEIPAITKGANSITLDKQEIPYGNKLAWSVEISNYTIPRVTRITAKTDDKAFVRAIGVVADKSPESPYFGQIYVGSNKDGAAGGRNVKKGIYVYDAQFNAVNNTAYTGGEAWGSNWRMGIDEDGFVYVSEWSDGHSGIYRMNPATPDGTFLQIFRNGTRNADGLFSNSNGIAIGGSTTSVAVIGKGADKKMYTFDEDLKISGKGNNVLCYNLGTQDIWNEAPSHSYAVGALEINGNGHIVPDKNGGVWVSQFRSSANNTPAVPSLIYVDATGKVLFNSGTDLEEHDGSAGSGFAITPEGNQLLMNDAKGEVKVYDIAWNEGKPSLILSYSFKHDLGGADLYQMSFDYAGNLVATGGYMGVFALPNDDNKVETPARKEFVIEGRKIIAVAPTDAITSDNPDGSIQLSWTAPVTDAEVTYNLYLNSVKVNTAPVGTTSYRFDRPEEGTHTFAVTAVYPDGQESEAAAVTKAVTSVDEAEMSTEFGVYPNPTTGIITITGVAENTAIQVFNSNGLLVMKGLAPQLDLSDFANGTYLIRTENKTVRVIKK